MYCEKALAQDNPGEWLDHQPGYDGLVSGNAESWDTYMTGKDTETVSFAGVDGFSDAYQEAVDALAEGKGVVISNAGWSFTSADDDL